MAAVLLPKTFDPTFVYPAQYTETYPVVNPLKIYPQLLIAKERVSMHVSFCRCAGVLFPALFLHLCSPLGWSQQSPPTNYDPRATFAPLVLPDPVNTYRSSDGAPGPSYWQNQADYEIHAELDTAAKQLKATETISYTNNSPDLLSDYGYTWNRTSTRKIRVLTVWGSRGLDAATSRRKSLKMRSTDGFVLDSVQIGAGRRTTAADYIVSDTRMQIRLATD